MNTRVRRLILAVTAVSILSLAVASPARAQTTEEADATLPPVIEEVVTTSPNLKVNPDGTISPVIGKVPPMEQTQGSSSCTGTYGWAITKVNLKGGASGWTVAWHELRTDWCWNGTRILGTPTANDPRWSVTTYGYALGYKWTTEPKITNRQWITNPTKYRVQEAGTLAVCPLRVNIGCFGHIQPWIRHDMDHKGWVSKAVGY